MRNLEHVEMIQNGTRVEGIKELAKAFELNPNIAHIDLNDNILTPAGAEALAVAIKVVINVSRRLLTVC